MRLQGGRRPYPIDTNTGDVAGDLLITEEGATVIAGDLIRSEAAAEEFRAAEAVRAEVDANTPEGEEPVYPTPLIQTQGGSDFCAGQFSRIHTGVTERSYRGVVDALRAGRVWVDHGHLLAGFVVKVETADAAPVALGGRLQVVRGGSVEVSMTITTTTKPVRYIDMSEDDPDGVDPTFAVEKVPNVAFVDIIGGPITGPVADPETHRAPHSRVLRSFDTAGRTGTYTLTHRFENVQESFYIRFRGSDGGAKWGRVLRRRRRPRRRASPGNPPSRACQTPERDDSVADQLPHSGPVLLLDVTTIVLVSRPTSGGGDLAGLAVVQQVVVDELRPVVRVDSTDLEREQPGGMVDRFEHPPASLIRH